MRVKLLYRDGGNWKTEFEVQVPKELEPKIALNGEYEIEEFDMTPHDIYKLRPYSCDPELDHNLVDVIEILPDIKEGEQSFDVEVIRTVHSIATISVEASSEEEAKEKAESRFPNGLYTERNFYYNIRSVHPSKRKEQ